MVHILIGCQKIKQQLLNNYLGLNQYVKSLVSLIFQFYRKSAFFCFFHCKVYIFEFAMSDEKEHRILKKLSWESKISCLHKRLLPLYTILHTRWEKIPFLTCRCIFKNGLNSGEPFIILRPNCYIFYHVCQPYKSSHEPAVGWNPCLKLFLL